MGADLIFSCIPAVIETPARRIALAAHIRNFNDEQMQGLEDCGFLNIKATEKERLAAEVQAYWNLNLYRDVDMIHLPGAVPHYITAGLSWGDSPTDSFDTFELLCNIPGLYDLFWQWARDDKRVDQSLDQFLKDQEASKEAPCLN